MIRHLFKLVWNRKRTQLLIMLEVFLSFLVVFALVTTGLHFLRLYRLPSGFEYENVWVVTVDRETGRHEWEPEEAQTFRALRRELESMPPVLGVASAGNYPFSTSDHIRGWTFQRREIEAESTHASGNLPEVLGVEVVAGRWFESGDGLLGWQPLVIDRRLARDLFGDEDPLGRSVRDEPAPGDEPAVDRRVVGVIESFRRGGPLETPSAFMFLYADEERDAGEPTRHLLVRLQPETTAAFEAPMLERLQSIARGWTLTVEPLAEARESIMQAKLVPLAIFAVIGAFLLIMVVLGLTGVMWQNVTRRTREIGLRRATGARRGLIHRQIVAEVMITAFFGVALGLVIGLQVPIVGPFTFLPLAVVLGGLAVSTVSMLLLAALCGLYPGWSATRVQPAEALHYQ